MTERNTVFLGLGSNLGNRLEYLRFAVRELTRLMEGIRFSGVYETDPMYVPDQDRFLNAVVTGMTEIDPVEFLKGIQDIEFQAGRNRIGVPEKGPRVLDIDILLFGDRIISTDRLVCPHPLMRERLFVLIPLLELHPDCTEPGTGVHYSRYRDALQSSEHGVRAWNETI